MHPEKEKRLSKQNIRKLFFITGCLIIYVAIWTPAKPNKVFILGKPTPEGLGAKYAHARTVLNPSFRAGFQEWSTTWTESVLHTAKLKDAFGTYVPGFDIAGFTCFIEISPPEDIRGENSINERITASSLQLHRLLGCNSLVVPSIRGTPEQIADDSETLISALKCPFPVVNDLFLIGYHWRRGDVSADAKNERERSRYVPWTQVVSDIDSILAEDSKNRVYIITEGSLKMQQNWTGRVKLDNSDNIQEVMCNARRFRRCFAQFGNFGQMLQAASSYEVPTQNYSVNIGTHEYTLEISVFLIYLTYCFVCRYFFLKNGSYYFSYNYFTSTVLFAYRVASLLTLIVIPQSKNNLWIPRLLTRGTGKLNSFDSCTGSFTAYLGEYKFVVCKEGYGIAVASSDILFGPLSLYDTFDISFSYIFGSLWRAGFILTCTDFILLCIAYWRSDFSLISGTMIHWTYAVFLSGSSSEDFSTIPRHFSLISKQDLESEKSRLTY